MNESPPIQTSQTAQCMCPPGFHPYSTECLKPEHVGRRLLPPTGDLDEWMDQLAMIDNYLVGEWTPERESKLTSATGLTWRQAEKELLMAILPLIVELRKERYV